MRPKCKRLWDADYGFALSTAQGNTLKNKTLLETNSILSGDELAASKKVLSAAAMTYVASAVVAIANLLRLLSILGFGRNRD